MGNRTEQLRSWGVPQTLLGMADGKLPHAAFEAWCEPLRVDEHQKSWRLNLDRAETRDETGGVESAALWEHDLCDGHAFEVIYCANGKCGLEFWHVIYADDTDGPDAELVARSEQGLFYWLFFWLIGSEYFAHGERAYTSLATAAKAVSFRHLVEVLSLEKEIGSDNDLRSELVSQSLAIT